MSEEVTVGTDGVYENLVERCAKIDKRSTRYRFELEKAVPWTRLDEPGEYFGLELLETLGVDVAPLKADPTALACFEWCFAVATCEEFIELEDVVLAYLADERAAHEGIRSVTLLEEEEQKHIELFHRYADHLKQQRPEWAPAFAQALAASPRAARQIVLGEAYPNRRVRAYLFWLFTVLFEEYTIYLHHRLVAAPRTQPAWLSAHAAHRREEEQHVITDREHLRAVRLDEEERTVWSKRFYLWISTHIHEFTGLETARRAFALLRPDVSIELVPFQRTRFRRDVSRERTFKWTREGAPALAALVGAKEPTPVVAPEPPPTEAKAAGPNLAARFLQTARSVTGTTAKATAHHYRLTDLASPAAAGAAAAPAPAPTLAAPAPVAATAALELLTEIWAEILERDATTIGPDATFTSLGGDSLKAAEIHARLETHYGKALPLEMLLDCQTTRQFAAYLTEHYGPAPQRTRPAPRVAAPKPTVAPTVAPTAAPTVAPGEERAVAIVAAACRFPGADDLDALWALLRDGRTAFRAVPAERWDAKTSNARGATPERLGCTTGAFLDDPGAFDPEAFGLSEAEAREMDPQQRLFLELAADLVARAPATSRSIGVFAATGGNEYFLHFTDDLARMGQLTALGNLGNMVAARVAQVLGLRGPALTVDAACASSLVAVHLACQSVLAGECDLAVAGGVQTNLTAVPYAMFGQTGVLSPTGRCQPYSTSAAGFIPGEGGGAVLLKPLARALADGDAILAVVRGAAMNNDGGGLSGMAPTPIGQLEVIQKALAAARVSPSTIGYVEGHGSATPIGDLVETRALGQAFADAGGERYVGSIKSNVGHCFAAAGIAGLLKTVLALRHGEIPPTVGCEEPQLRLFAGTTFRPATRLLPFPAIAGEPRRAGVSAFGVGGTNCHVVLEAAPAAKPAEARLAAPRRPLLLCVSAPTSEELQRVASTWAQRLETRASTEVAAFVAEVNLHARRHPVRRSAVVSTLEEVRRVLVDIARPASAAARPATHAPAAARVCLVFSGPGSQVPGMGRMLYETEPVFRAALLECSTLLGHGPGKALPRPLEALLYDEQDLASPAMDRIEVTQPVIFSFGYALWRWLEHQGVVPDAVLGHSAAEYLAAHVAGAFTLEKALQLVTERGRAMAATGPGKMAAVFAPEARVQPYLARTSEVGFAALNEPSQVVISGPSAAVDRLLATLSADGIASQELRISCAAHSPVMQRAAERLAPHLARVTPRALRRAFYSTVTGELVPAGQRLDAAYWQAQLPAPVAFARAVARARADGIDAFVEVGASGALTHCVEQVLGEGSPARTFTTPLLRRSVPGWEPTLEALGAMFEHRVAFDPSRLGARDLPTSAAAYPYRRRRFWVTAPERGQVLTPANEPSIRDHVFRDRAIAPAALLLELALVEARRRDPSVTGFENVLVTRQLALQGSPRRVLTKPLADDPARLALTSTPTDGSGGPEEHLSATPSRGPTTPMHVDLAALRARCPDAVTRDRLYAHLAACRMTYGPTMTTVASIQRGTDELLARLELPVGAEREVQLHPSILDGAMQAIGGFLVDLPAHADATFFGFSIQRLEVHAPARTSCWAHVRLQTPLSPEMQALRCHVDLVDDDGRVLVRYHDVGLRRFEEPRPRVRESVPERERVNENDIRLYAIEGVPAPLAERARARRSLPREVLLVSPDDGFRRGLQRALQDLGVHVFTLAPSSDEAALTARLGRMLPVETVLALTPTAEQLYVLARALGACRVDRLQDLCVVAEDPAPLALLRVVALERPSWSCRGIELIGGEERTGGRVLRAVVDEWRGAGDELTVRLRGEAREVPALRPLRASSTETALRPGGVYWITGGLGGVGLALARKLVTACGARLLLTGRRERPDAEAARSLAELERLGGRVLYVAADTTDPVAMARARDRALEELGGLHGVIHAAGVVDQSLLGQRSPAHAVEAFRAVLEPKVAGGRVLAEVLRGQPLDFVALFSSLVALYGAPGQADYAAANAALDGLARTWPGPARRVVSLAWGPWRDTGMMSAPQNRGFFDAQGLLALDPDAAGDAFLGALTATDAHHVMLVGVRDAREPLLHALLGGRPSAAASSMPSAPVAAPVISAPVAAAPVAVAPVAVVPRPAPSAASAAPGPFLLQELSKALRRPLSEADARVPFRQLGVDSLMAVGLVRKLESELGLQLHPTLLFEHPTVDDVARYLDGRQTRRSA